jgi:hypothetical protein
MRKGCPLAGGDDRPLVALDDPPAFPSFNGVAFRIAHLSGVPLAGLFRYPDSSEVTT